MDNNNKKKNIDQELNEILETFSRLESAASAKRRKQPDPAALPQSEQGEKQPAASLLSQQETQHPEKPAERPSTPDTSAISRSLDEIWEGEPRTKVFSIKKSRALLEKQQAFEKTESERPSPRGDLPEEPLPNASVFDAVRQEEIGFSGRDDMIAQEKEDFKITFEPISPEDRYYMGHEDPIDEAELQPEGTVAPLFSQKRSSEDFKRTQERMEAARNAARQDPQKPAPKKKLPPLRKKKGAKQEILEWVRDFVVSFVVVALFFTFICKVVAVDGDSMLPTLHDGNRLIVSGLFYTPENGDIVVTNKDNALNKRLIKRVIAVGGQTVDFDREGRVLINGVLLDEDYILEEALLYGDWDYPLTVPEGSVFLMGDNRNNSLDSRFTEVGLVSEDDIIGRAIFRIFPFSEIGKVK